MLKDIAVNGKHYALLFYASEIVGGNDVPLPDDKTEELLEEIQKRIVQRANAEDGLVQLSSEDLDLIRTALNCMEEALNSEIKYAIGDPDIVEADQDWLDSIDALREKL